MHGFTKHRRDAPSGFFAVEAAGLAWLTTPGGVRVARVLECTPDSLTLERIETIPATPEAGRLFGTQLATTHDAGAAAFGTPPQGWSGDGFIGDAPLMHRAEQQWGRFYAQQRVLPFARSATSTGALSRVGLSRIESLAERLNGGEFDDPAPPARIHGDLWAGNVLFDRAGAVLINPAAHGGHRITDLAMLALFGFPNLSEVYAGYEAASKWLPPGWRDLIGLHQIHPLLVHAVLFGGGYGDEAAAISSRY